MYVVRAFCANRPYSSTSKLGLGKNPSSEKTFCITDQAAHTYGDHGMRSVDAAITSSHNRSRSSEPIHQAIDASIVAATRSRSMSTTAVLPKSVAYINAWVSE